MAVVKPIRLASHFWPIFARRKIILISIVQIIITLVVVTALVTTNTLRLDSAILWLITLLLLAMNLSTSLLIFIYVTKPTRDLLAAVINVAGEQSSLTLPNPNSAQNELTGLRDALQTIYELSSKKNEIKNDDSAAKKTNYNNDAMLSRALDSTACGFVAIGSDKSIIFANKSAPTHTNTDGKLVLDLLFNGTDTLSAWLDECAENAVHDNRTWTRIPDKLPNEENRRFFDVIASYQKGSTAEAVLTLIDRTNLYSVDEENLDFISFAAHELRGPITIIRGYLDVLSDELAEVMVDDQAELFRRLVVSSNRLAGYIDNILNTSRYDRRHLKMNLAEDTISAIYDTISDDMTMRANAQNRLLNVTFPDDLPTVAADRASIGEVFGNLIDNAIKYSNEGGVINVTARVNDSFVEVSVEDHGIGMPDSVVSNLFQKFYRSHRSRETVAGTGIGLYISKAIVESHGGIISVRSEDGHGSTFTVSLPIYATVADKLKANNNSNEGLISEGNGWIKNHSMFRG